MSEKSPMESFWGQELRSEAAQPGADPEKIPKPEPFPKPAIPLTPDAPKPEEPVREPDRPDQPLPEKKPEREPETVP